MKNRRPWKSDEEEEEEEDGRTWEVGVKIAFWIWETAQIWKVEGAKMKIKKLFWICGDAPRLNFKFQTKFPPWDLEVIRWYALTVIDINNKIGFLSILSFKFLESSKSY